MSGAEGAGKNPAMRKVVVFVNPHSGTAADAASELVSRVPGLQVEECEPADLAACARAAIDDGAEVVGVVGGDGTFAAAAGVLADGEVPLLPVPGGTLNHFARANGLSGADQVVAALEQDEVRRVDLGWVSNRPFLNNASIGWYPQMLRRKERLERWLPRRLARFAAFAIELPRAHRFAVEVAGETLPAWLTFIGNGRYGTTASSVGERDDLADGVLDVRIARTDAAWARLRLAARIVLGDMEDSPLLERVVCQEIVVMVGRSARVHVALDGELMRLPNPLRFTVRPSSLPVLAPAPSGSVA